MDMNTDLVNELVDAIDSKVGTQGMTLEWLWVLANLDEAVDELVNETGDNESDNYQLKLNLLKTISRKALVGELTHLPTNLKCKVYVRLPI